MRDKIGRSVGERSGLSAHRFLQVRAHWFAIVRAAAREARVDLPLTPMRSAGDERSRQTKILYAGFVARTRPSIARKAPSLFPASSVNGAGKRARSAWFNRKTRRGRA